MRLPIALAAVALVIPAAAFACEDYQSSASVNMPASLASSAPAASKAPTTIAKQKVTQSPRQAAAKPVAPNDKQLVAGLRRD